MRLCLIGLLAFSVSIVTGCGQNGDAGSQSETNDSANGTLHVRTAKSSTPLLSVGEVTLTCGDFNARLTLEEELWAFRRFQKVARSEAAIKGFAQSRFRQIMPQLVNQTIVALEAKVRKLTLSAREEKDAVSTFLKKMGFKGTLQQFAGKIGVKEDYLTQQICAPLLLNRVCTAFEPDSAVVSEKEIDEGLARMASYFERATASNAVTWASCSNVFAKIKAGMPFAEAGKKFGAEASEAEQWESFAGNEISSLALKKWAFSAKVGSMEIFDLEDGLSIVKILHRKEGTMEPSVVSLNDAEVTLARVNFLMLDPEPEPRTRAHVKSALLKWKASQVQKRMFKSIANKYPVKSLVAGRKLEL